MKKSQWIKRILCMAMVVMLLTGLATSALAVGRSSTHAKTGDQYYVVCSRLNVRSGKPGVAFDSGGAPVDVYRRAESAELGNVSES